MLARQRPGVALDTDLVDPHTRARNRNRDRAGGFGETVRRGQCARVEAEARHSGGEPLGAVAVDGLAAVEGEPQMAQVDAVEAAGVLAHEVVGHVRCRGQGGATLGEPLEPSERRRGERRRRGLPELDAAQGAGQQERQAHVVIDRQPGVAAVVGVDADAGDQALVVGQRGGGRDLRRAWGSGRSGGALQDGDVAATGPSRRPADRWACATVLTSCTAIASPPPRSSASCSPWLKTVPTPIARNLASVAWAHCAGSAPRIGPGRIDTRGAGEHRAGDGRDQFHRRVSDESDGCRTLLAHPLGDVLGAGVNLRPRVPRPNATGRVEQHQVAVRARHRLR